MHQRAEVRESTSFVVEYGDLVYPVGGYLSQTLHEGDRSKKLLAYSNSASSLHLPNRRDRNGIGGSTNVSHAWPYL